MEKEMYVLNVLDNEDDYIYYSLLFSSNEEVWFAKKVIADFDGEWYGEKDDDYRASHDYEVELINRLNDYEDLHYTALNISNIYVR